MEVPGCHERTRTYLIRVALNVKSGREFLLVSPGRITDGFPVFVPDEQ